MANKIILTPEIEKKLERMSDELLIKTVTFYKNYNYDISVRNKAFKILQKRGISIESVEIIQPKTTYNVIIVGILIFSILGFTIYLHFYPNYLLSGVRLLLISFLLLIFYWTKYKRDKYK